MSDNQIKSFKISQKESEESDELAPSVTVNIDGREVTFLGPNSTESTMILMAMSSHKTMFVGVANTLDVILGLIESDEDSRWLHSRLLDRRDAMSIEDVTDIVVHLVEEWFARPTQEQPTSSSSRRSTGKTSTASQSRKGSSRSPSALTAS